MNENRAAEPPEWYGYSLKFDFVMHEDEMVCDILKEARIEMSPFDPDWLHVYRVEGDAEEHIRVEFDMRYVSLPVIHEIIGAYLFNEEGIVVPETEERFKFREDEDGEWLESVMG